MQAGLFAKKVGMTQIFDESGTVLPVTILKTGLCQISQIKTVKAQFHADVIRIRFKVNCVVYQARKSRIR